jgi:hypothetical protein
MRSILAATLLVAGCSGASASPIQPPRPAAATFTRSAAAGTWSVTVTSSSGAFSFVLHLAGPDEALVGASSYGGQVTGDFADGALRLNVVSLLGGTASYSAATLLDCSVSADEKTATGTSVGTYPGNVTMTRS